MRILIAILLTGFGATAIVDAWALLRRHLFQIALPDYGLVGRWLGYLPRGQFVHARIAATPPLRGERVLGWTAHYLIGIAFAALVPLAWGEAWLRHPTLLPALSVGVATVLAPFLLMQPGMGAGIAASRTPRPARARMHSLATHAVFGLGLYASAWPVAVLVLR